MHDVIYHAARKRMNDRSFIGSSHGKLSSVIQLCQLCNMIRVGLLPRFRVFFLLGAQWYAEKGSTVTIDHFPHMPFARKLR